VDQEHKQHEVGQRGSDPHDLGNRKAGRESLPLLVAWEGATYGENRVLSQRVSHASPCSLHPTHMPKAPSSGQALSQTPGTEY
jgi:hypothetical protein